MISPLRFGKVAVLQHIDKELAKRFISPTTRVYYLDDDHKRAFVITGQEDVLLVNLLETERQKARTENQSDLLRSVTNALYRFLLKEGYNCKTGTDTYIDPYKDNSLELLG